MADHLPFLALQTVFSKIDAADCARVSCVNRRWRHSAEDEVLWKDHCLSDLGISSPVDHLGNSYRTFKEAYAIWHVTFPGYPKPVVARGNRCWQTIKDWLKVNFTEVLDSLAPGAEWAEIEKAEEDIGFRLPDSARVLYRLCNGQELPNEDDMEKLQFDCSYLGLLGGYHFYEHFVNVYLLPLKQVVMLTKSVRSQLGMNSGLKRIVIAASCNSMKLFFLDCDDGQVYVGSQSLESDGEMLPCTPVQDGGKDGMLRWLEYYGQQLQKGMYGVRNYGIRSISLFPLKEPLCTQAISNGLQVQCSAVFVPECSRLKLEFQDDINFMFAYSVRMRLLQENNRIGNMLMESAQLVDRHWVTRENEEIKGEVRGKAVIGLHPFLKAGGDEFMYESCTYQKSKTGDMQGDFTFVPGRLSRQEGPQFVAYVARFPLEVPDYIF